VCVSGGDLVLTAGQDPNFEQERKEHFVSNVYLIIYCNIAFTSAAIFRNITFRF
jgi:hypothetical protein